MGTNYYYYSKEPCPHCGRQYEPTHIGKSSGGWCFSLHVHPDMNINDLDDWLRLFKAPKTQIVDEYGTVITPLDMTSFIVDRSWPIPWDRQWAGYRSEEEFHERNGSKRGPKYLLRHKISNHCIANGKGTWDCIIGEFS